VTDHTGGMIALVPTAADAQKLAVPGGDPADEMHLTLAYLGDDVTKLPDHQVAALKHGTAAIARGIGKPVDGQVFGHAVFNPNSSEFDPAHVYMVNGHLAPAREAAHRIGQRVLGGDYPTQHPNFVPHVTAGYDLPPGKLRHTGPVTFDRLRLALGGKTHDYPLGEAVTLSNTVELSAKTPALASVHHPLGDPAGPGLFKVKGLQLPAYIQNIARAIMRGGVPESRAISIAIGRVEDWATGKGKVSPEVRAASAKAVAEWEAARARAKAKPNEHAHANPWYDNLARGYDEGGYLPGGIVLARNTTGRPIELSQPRRPTGNTGAGQWFADDPATPRSAPVPTVNQKQTKTSTKAPTAPLVERLYKVFLAKGMKPDAARRFAQQAALRHQKSMTKTANMAATRAAVDLAVPVRLRAKARQKAAETGEALPDGSWPIRTRGELADALRNWGHAVQAGNTGEVKAHMLKRAKALGASQAVLDHIQQLKE
jgi:hypothetical protein